MALRAPRREVPLHIADRDIDLVGLAGSGIDWEEVPGLDIDREVHVGSEDIDLVDIDLVEGRPVIQSQVSLHASN